MEILKQNDLSCEHLAKIVVDVNALNQDLEKYKIWYHNIMTFLNEKSLI